MLAYVPSGALALHGVCIPIIILCTATVGGGLHVVITALAASVMLYVLGLRKLVHVEYC